MALAVARASLEPKMEIRHPRGIAVSNEAAFFTEVTVGCDIPEPAVIAAMPTNHKWRTVDSCTHYRTQLPGESLLGIRAATVREGQETRGNSGIPHDYD